MHTHGYIHTHTHTHTQREREREQIHTPWLDELGAGLVKIGNDCVNTVPYIISAFILVPPPSPPITPINILSIEFQIN